MGPQFKQGRGDVMNEGGKSECACSGRKVLYAASTFGHLRSFHLPYIEALRADGFDVTLLAGGDPVAAGMPQGVRCIPADFVKSMSSPRNFAVAREVSRLQLRERFDIVLTHTSLAAFFVRLGIMEAAWRDKGLRPRVVNTVHGYLFDADASFPRRAALLAAERLCAGVTDQIVVMNRQDAIIAREHRLCRGQVVETPGMGVVLDGLHPASACERASARRALGMRDDAFVCLCVAEFSQRKNQRLLIEALPNLPERVVLALPGKGFEQQACLGLARELGVEGRVSMPGHLDAAGLALWRAASDVCVSASRYEGLPFHVVEAFACGLPAVLSSVKGHVDLVDPSVNGLLFNQGDAAGFCSCVERLLADPALLVEMGEHAVATSARYSLSHVFKPLLAVYEGRGASREV